MKLPDELLLITLSYLNKRDLKTARVVCKTWSCCSAEYLFDKVFVSPHELNLQVFKDISQHPLLRKCVRTLEYDGAHFLPNMTFASYFTELLNDVSCHLMSLGGPSDNPPSPDPQIHQLTSLAIQRHRIDLSGDPRQATKFRRKALAKCSDFYIIQSGYREYL